MSRYWRLARAPRYSLLFALPLLVLYELLALAISHDPVAGIRNGADVLLKALFVGFGGQRGLLVFGGLLIGAGLVLVARDMRKSGAGLEPRVFLGMLAESAMYGVLVGIVTSLLTGILLGGVPVVALVDAPLAELPLATQLTLALGAGLYEELLFRVLLVSALAALARGVFNWRPAAAGIFATLVGALIFSAFHYVGPYGDALELPSFTFRAIAGVIFSALYLVRGFGIAAWTHALYDVFVILGTR